MFMNSTDVASGRRLIVNIVCADAGEFDEIFSSAPNSMTVLGDELRTNTAIHMSARFTYVSPAGTIHRADHEQLATEKSKEPARIRDVDGGYFENSGTVTALELVKKLQSLDANLRPIVIFISNEDEAPDRGARRARSQRSSAT